MYTIHLLNKQYQKNKSFFANQRYIFLLLIIFLLMSYQSNSDDSSENNFYNEINLVLKGSGEQQLYHYSEHAPFEVIVNGVTKVNDTSDNICILEEEESNITLKFNKDFTTFDNMFKGMNNLIEVEFVKFNSSGVSKMGFMFSECSNLESVNFGNIDTSSVIDMSYLFRDCKNLKNIELSNLDTSSVLYMDYMFYGCSSLESINLSNFNTSNVKQMRSMFNHCLKLYSLDISNFDLSKVTTMVYMFNNCKGLRKINFGNTSTSEVETTFALFAGCRNLQSLDISIFDTSKVTNMNQMFKGCWALQNLNISHFNVSNVLTMSNMFYECKALRELDLSSLDTSKVTDMAYMFFGCNNLMSINLTNINTSSVKNMSHIFSNCQKLTELNLTNFDTSLVTNMMNMFNNCENLKSIIFSDLFNTSQVEFMSYMFNNCSSLTSIDLSNFDITKVEAMDYMFNNCTNLQYLNLSKFHSMNINTIESMFNNCKSLIYLNLISFEINEETNIKSVFNLVSPTIKFCLNGTNIITNLLNIYNYTSDCSNICFQENVKIDLNNSQCICADNTYITTDNPNICYNATPEGYYLDINESIYKKCFHSCKYCNGPGDEIDNKCLECLENFSFLNDSLYNMSCFKQCDNYYYFDDNCFQCTGDENCPEGYNKLILDKKKCVNECSKDDIYKYEFNNICVKNCPDGTFVGENNYICLNETNLELTAISNKFSHIYDIDNEKNITNLKSESDSYITIITFIEKESDIKTQYETNVYINSNKTELKFSTPIEVQKFFQKILSEKFNTTNIDKGIDFIYSEGQYTFTITTPSNQRNNTSNNVTLINLGQCENILKEEYNISEEDNLYIFKIDYYIEGLLGPKVEYEVYYPLLKNHLKLANLSLCDDVNIEVSIPLDIPLSEIDKYNASSGYYNDLCYTLTTESNTDISLKDRREEFLNNNISICEEGCKFTEYDKVNKKATCSCFTKIKLPLITEIIVDKDKFLHNFYDINNIANVKMLKCYKLLFDKEKIFRNSANYVLVLLLFTDILASIIFCSHNKIKINKDIKQIYIETNLNESGNKGQLTTNNNKKEGRKKAINKLTANNKKDTNKNKIKQHEPPKKNSKLRKRKTMLDKNQIKKNLETTNAINLNENISKQIGVEDNKDKNNPLFLNINLKPKKRKTILNKVKKIGNDNSINPLKGKSSINMQNSNLNNKKQNENNEIIYKDVELNDMDYEDALKYDQRNLIQYYFSLIKSQHLLIFTFCECKDYNSQIIKLNLFCFSFSINYIISAMFYSDDTMHKIYVDEGDFDFIYQLPQMLYSSILSFFLEWLLGNLGLYEGDILEVRKLKKDKKLLEKSLKDVSKKIEIKIIFFFIITYILSFTFWFYLGCFCAVYKNTQIHLLTEVSSSFVISFVSPFFMYIIPGFLRIVSLHNRKSDRPCIYKISKFIQMF